MDHYPYTDAQLIELGRCSRDPAYFLTKYMGLSDEDLQVADTHIAECSQKYGLSLLTWLISFRGERTYIVGSTTHARAVALLDEVKRLHESLPEWLRTQYIRSYSLTGEAGFENRARLKAAHHYGSFRGMAVALAYFDSVDLEKLDYHDILPAIYSRPRGPLDVRSIHPDSEIFEDETPFSPFAIRENQLLLKHGTRPNNWR